MIRCTTLGLMLVSAMSGVPRWQWKDLPALPQAVAGAFAGVVDDHLIVAGGSYWRGAPWIAGSEKIYSKTIYSLPSGGTAWSILGSLPTPLGYGASFVHGGALWLIGGQNADGAQGSILRIDPKGAVEKVGKLPAPLMMTSAAHSNSDFYLLGGQPNLRTCLRSQDLVKWTACSPWPGPGRFFAQAVASQGSVYFGGGSDLEGARRIFLRDAYRLSDGAWSRLPDLPVAMQAGSPRTQGGSPVFLGGSDGALAPFEAELAGDHPGFSTLIWKFDGTRWFPFGRMPCAPVTSTLVEWRGGVVIPGGEDRPAHRSARVILGQVSNE